MSILFLEVQSRWMLIRKSDKVGFVTKAKSYFCERFMAGRLDRFSIPIIPLTSYDKCLLSPRTCNCQVPLSTKIYTDKDPSRGERTQKPLEPPCSRKMCSE